MWLNVASAAVQRYLVRGIEEKDRDPMSLRPSRGASMLLAIAILCVAGCAGAPQRSQITELRRSVPNPKIVLMPMDVELSEMSAGGLLEPKADWTRAASDNLLAGLREERQRTGFNLVEFADVRAEGDDADVLDQLNRLHGVVGKSIMVHRVVKLPNKDEQQFDWSLGREVKLLKDRSGADYALFVFIRDSYASDGRKAAIVAAAVFGVGLVGGTQLGFASLVDLDTGKLVWFNQIARQSGDLRTRESADETIKLLLAGFPK